MLREEMEKNRGTDQLHSINQEDRYFRGTEPCKLGEVEFERLTSSNDDSVYHNLCRLRGTLKKRLEKAQEAHESMLSRKFARIELVRDLPSRSMTFLGVTRGSCVKTKSGENYERRF